MLAHRANPTVETIVADSSKDPNAIEVTQIAGSNDEQKLPTNASWNDFGPIARLYTLRRARTTPEYQAGAMVAVLEVEPQAPMPPAYSRLGIVDNAGPNADVYCVFLQRTTNPGKPWQAALSKVTSTEARIRRMSG